jgi:hypothetical protein
MEGWEDPPKSARVFRTPVVARMLLEPAREGGGGVGDKTAVTKASMSWSSLLSVARVSEVRGTVKSDLKKMPACGKTLVTAADTEATHMNKRSGVALMVVVVARGVETKSKAHLREGGGVS